VTANLPDFTLSDPYVTKTVTVGDMYAHRSGLPAEAGDILETLGFSQEQILQRLRYQKLNPFRISYGYANYGITSGAESVAAAAGKDWPTLSQDDLYTPLGMTTTSSRFRDYVSRSDRAWTHVPVNGKWTPRYVRDADPQSPAGGVSSSVDDLAKWMVMVLHEGTGANGAKITTPAALTPAVTAQIVASPAQVPAARSGFYGFGFDVTTEGSGRVEISHSGAFSAGAGTNYVLIPSLDLGIVTVTNALPIGVAEALNQEFADLVQYGEPRTDWYDVYRQALGQLVAPTGRYVGKQPPTDPKPAGPAAAYVGIYRNDYYGYLRIEGNDGDLRLVLGPAQVTYSLRHWDAGVYVFEPTGEGQNAGSVSAANFTRSGSAGASAVTVEYLDDDGLGTFERVPGTR